MHAEAQGFLTTKDTKSTKRRNHLISFLGWEGNKACYHIP